jgi:hypothetical protein
MGCGGGKEAGDSSYKIPPVFQAAHVIGSEEVPLNPVRLSFRLDTLYVSYSGKPQIDIFTPDLDRIGSIMLNDPEPVFPTDFVVADSELYVCDHARGTIVVYDRFGRFRESYGTLPDNTTKLRPFALEYLGGVLYVGDAGQRQVLAISMSDAPGITERGELILSFPNDNSAHAVGFPSALLVTLDGRMIIGDAMQGKLEAFTCDGRYIYPFDTVVTESPMAPQGFAVDNIIDPSLQDSASFDPSGLRSIGRIHLVDTNAGQIHMFNPVGKYIASYPESGTLEKPSDIAIDTARRRVYVAEPVSGRIMVYRYGE